jgi:putative tryptophan/tyrosine transport system substrate-binding protein
MTAQPPPRIDGSQSTSRLSLSMPRFIVAVFVALLSGITIAEPDAIIEPVPVLLLIPEDSAVHSRFVDGFSACFGTKANSGSFSEVKSIKDVQARPELLKGQRIVAVGAKSSEFMQSNASELPFVSALVPETFVHKSLEVGGKSSEPVSFFFLDQPLNRRLSLIRSLLPAARNLSVVLGPGSAHLKDVISREASRLDFVVEAIVVRSGEELPKRSSGLFDASDGLFLVYDPLLTSSSVIKFLLYSAYQHRVPVFGYSEGYVKAGALAAVYSTSEGLGCQVGEYLSEHSRFPIGAGSGREPVAFYADYFRYAVNPSVASSLGIRIDHIPPSLLSDAEGQ